MHDPLATPWSAAVLRPLPRATGTPRFPALATADTTATGADAGAAVALWTAALPLPAALPRLTGLPTLAAAPAVPRQRYGAEVPAAL